MRKGTAVLGARLVAVLSSFGAAVVFAPVASAHFNGGGPAKSDCYVVYEDLEINKGANKVECTDGDPACEFTLKTHNGHRFPEHLAALHALDPTRHTIIYLPNPTVGVRGIHHQIVAALGHRPLTHHATLVPQTVDALAVEQAERGRTPVVVIDEAHLLDHDQLESIRMLTLCRARGYAEATPAGTRLSWSGRLHLSGGSA